MVDAEYSHTRGFLRHYSNCRYNIQVFCHGNAPQNKEERFNFHHSWLRNIIECCFGVIKVWFPNIEAKGSLSIYQVAVYSYNCHGSAQLHSSRSNI